MILSLFFVILIGCGYFYSTYQKNEFQGILVQEKNIQCFPDGVEEINSTYIYRGQFASLKTKYYKNENISYNTILNSIKKNKYVITSEGFHPNEGYVYIMKKMNTPSNMAEKNFSSLLSCHLIIIDDKKFNVNYYYNL